LKNVSHGAKQDCGIGDTESQVEKDSASCDDIQLPKRGIGFDTHDFEYGMPSQARGTNKKIHGHKSQLFQLPISEKRLHQQTFQDHARQYQVMIALSTRFGLEHIHDTQVQRSILIFVQMPQQE